MAPLPEPRPDTPRGDAAGGEAARGAPDGTLRFRVIRHEGWQKGIRLEQLFWHVLTRAARAAGDTLAGYVHGLLEAAGSANGTSELRVSALRHLVDEVAALEDAGKPARIVAAMLAAPVAAFAITVDRRIYAANRDFMALLRSNLAQGGALRSLETVRLSFDLPIPTLLEAIEQAGKETVVCGFKVASEERAFSGRARVLLTPARGEPIIVAYVEAGKLSPGLAVMRRR
jgi:predicted DNA-binding ribbon-helix-helix protein